MKKLLVILMVGSLFANDELSKKDGTTLNGLAANKTNPFLYGFNEIIRFNDLQAGDITEATNTVIKDADVILKQIIELDNKTRTFNNTMVRIDDIYNIGKICRIARENNIVTIGICFGFQLLSTFNNGKIIINQDSHYGETICHNTEDNNFFRFCNNIDLPCKVWMSHQNSIKFDNNPNITLLKSNNDIIGFHNHNKLQIGYLFHPEVEHTESNLQWFTNIIDYCKEINPILFSNIEKIFISKSSFVYLSKLFIVIIYASVMYVWLNYSNNAALGWIPYNFYNLFGVEKSVLSSSAFTEDIFKSPVDF